MSASEAPDAQMFLSRLRDHYVEQLLLFVAEQRRRCAQGAPEVKIELKTESSLLNRLYCADFICNDGEPEIVELQPERVLSFNPIGASLGNADIRFEHVRWDDILIHHNASADFAEPLAAWFEQWFDPDDRRYVAGAELGNIIHSVGVEPRRLTVDLGSATPDSLWELLNLLEKAGATELRISSSRAEAEAEEAAD